MRLLVLLMIAMLAACSNTPDAEQQAADDAAYSSDYTNYAENSKVATINLDQNTGKVASIEIGNQNLQPPQRKRYEQGLTGKIVDGVVTLGVTALNTAGSPTTALAVLGVHAIKNAGGNTHNDGSYNQNHEANQANVSNIEDVSGNKAGGDIDQSQHATTSQVEDISGIKIGGDADLSENNPVTNTQADDNSVTGSNNQDIHPTPPPPSEANDQAESTGN